MCFRILVSVILGYGTGTSGFNDVCLQVWELDFKFRRWMDAFGLVFSVCGLEFRV